VEASMSVTASVSGSYGAASMSVSATVGFGYTDSSTLSKSTAVKQVYNFRPGYVTTYYQWGVSVKDHQILNGQVKLEAKSNDALQALKAETETAASRVKLTLTKVVPPKDGFLIQNVHSGHHVMCHSYGKGNAKMEPTNSSKYNPLYAEVVDAKENLYRFRNKDSGYYLHCDGEGTGNVRLFERQHNICQIFKLQPTGAADNFTLASYNRERYQMYGDHDGTGNVFMAGNKNNSKCQHFRFVAPKKSYL